MGPTLRIWTTHNLSPDRSWQDYVYERKLCSHAIEVEDRERAAEQAMAAASSVCCSCSSSLRGAPGLAASPLQSPTSPSSALASSSSASFGRVRALYSKSRSSPSVLRRGHDRRFTLAITAMRDDGDWGARDPTHGEIESNFGDKVLGFEGTEHIKLIPPSLLGLSERSCTPLPPGTVPLSQEEATALLRKIIGWRLAKTDNGYQIWSEWKLKDFGSGITLFGRIAAVAEAEEQFPDLHLQGLTARAELSSQSIGGLSLNDFIFAAKIDKIKTSDLVKKNRFWA